MKQQRILVGVSVLCSALLLFSPLSTAAEPEVIEPTDLELSPVIVTEVQTGNAARADEFVELFNTTDAPIDLTGWQLRYVTASATSTKNIEDPSNKILLAPPLDGVDPIELPAGGHYLLYSGAVSLPAGVIGQQYEGLLPATGGSLALVRPDNAECEFVVEDAIAWGNTTHLFGYGESLVQGTSSSVDRLYQRFVDAEGKYVDTQANAQDFISTNANVGTPSPGTSNSILLPTLLPTGAGVTSQTLPERIANPDCTLPEPDPDPPPDPTPDESPPSVPGPTEPDPDDDQQPTIPAANIGLKSPLLSEFLPNPASPQTDKDDEFIELYNPNAARFDLSGYVLEVGLKTKRRYTIPTGTVVKPKAFLAFFSADTHLALSNSGSVVALVDPLGRVLVLSQPYASAKDGQAWVLSGGKWQWTTKPTPNAINMISTPVAKTSSTKKPKSSSSAQVAGASTSGGAAGDQQLTASFTQVASVTPLHPGVLALIGVFALLYGAYEYRHDMANKLYQLRSNRAARRELRHSAKGR